MSTLLLFAALCGLEGSLWLLPATQLDPLSLSLLGALVCWTLWAVSRPRLPTATPHWLLPCLGAGAFALPAILLAVAQHLLPGQEAAAILAGAPVLVVITSNLLESQQGDLPNTLLPVLAGLAGALLLLPVRVPTAEGWIGLALDLIALVLASVCATLTHRFAHRSAPRASFRYVALGNAVAYTLATARLWAKDSTARPSFQPATLLNLLVLGLGQALAFSLVRSLLPVRFATRSLLVPLLAAVESFLLWRPSLSLRDLVGASLMLASSVAVFRQHPSRSPAPDLPDSP